MWKRGKYNPPGTSVVCWANTLETFIQSFSIANVTGTLGRVILCRVGCPVHCRMYSCITGHHSLNVSSTTTLPRVVADQHFSRNYQVSPGWQNHPRLRTPALTFLWRDLALTIIQLPLESPLTVLSDGDILCQFPHILGTQSERIIPQSPQALSNYLFSFKTISSLETPAIAGPPTIFFLSAIH